MASVFEQLMAQNRDLAPVEPKRTVKKESKKIPVKKIKLESRKIYEEEDLDAIDDKFSVDMDTIEDADTDEVVLVIDPELPAEGEEEPEVEAEEMVGDMVYKCPVCGANYLCDCDHLEEEGIEVDEDGTPVACPICGDEADQILVGEIAPAEDVKPEDETEQEPIDPDEGEKEEEKPEEAEDEFKVDFEEKEEVEEESVKREACKDNEKKEDAPKARRPMLRPSPRKEESVDRPRRPIPHRPMPRRPRVAESAKRPLMNKRTNLPRRKVESLEIDDFRFESLMNKHFRENYKGNPVCKLRDASIDKNNTLRLEYVIRNGNKKPVTGTLAVENFKVGNGRNVVLTVKDITNTFSKSNKPAFMMECVKIGNKINPTSLRYNYVRKVNTESYQVSGKVSLNESAPRTKR